MKKIFSIVAMATLMVAGMTSCSNNDEEMGGQSAQAQSGINFDVKSDIANVTRGYATTASNATSTISSFQTWAYDDTTDGLYMGDNATTGRIVSNTGDALAPVWSYSPTQFWPVHPLNFVSVAPSAAPTGGTLTHSTASATNVVTLTSTFVNPTDVENQVDLVYAEADDIEKGDATSTVPFTFKHALSQILFKGKFNAAGAVTKVVIAEISMVNVEKGATIAYTSDGHWFGGANSEVYPTVVTPNLATFTLEASDLQGATFEAADYHHAAVLYADVDEYNTAKGTSLDAAAFAALSDAEKTKTDAYEEAFDLTISENASKKNAWFMVPQRTAKASGTYKAGDSAPASGCYLKVRAQLEKDGVVILGNTDADALYIPFDANWDRSKKYIYTLEFNGMGALTPITFTVTAQDWTDASPQPDDLNF